MTRKHWPANKPLPRFASEEEELAFWERHDVQWDNGATWEEVPGPVVAITATRPRRRGAFPLARGLGRLVGKRHDPHLVVTRPIPKPQVVARHATNVRQFVDGRHVIRIGHEFVDVARTGKQVRLLQGGECASDGPRGVCPFPHAKTARVPQVTSVES
jgi:hypothetical protein